MKVCLVEKDNGESYEDYNSWVEKVFTSFRSASEWLIKEGYEPYLEYNFKGELELDFYWQESDEYMASCSNAKIIEMEVNS